MRVRSMGLALLLAALAGCGSDGLTEVVDTQTDRQQARAQWTALGLSSYSLEMKLTCFCPRRVNLWHRLRVENDTVVAAQLANPDDAVGFDEEEVPVTVFPTVNTLFGRIVAEQQRSDGFAVVRFDVATGLPVFAELGTLANDAGVRYELRRLQPLVP